MGVVFAKKLTIIPTMTLPVQAVRSGLTFYNMIPATCLGDRVEALFLKQLMWCSTSRRNLRNTLPRLRWQVAHSTEQFGGD